MINLRIVIPNDHLDFSKIKSILEESSLLRLTPDNIQSGHHRGLDVTVLVAIVGVIGAGLVALITGLLKVIEKMPIKKILLRSSEGLTLEVHGAVTPEEIGRFIKKFERLKDKSLNVMIN